PKCSRTAHLQDIEQARRAAEACEQALVGKGGSSALAPLLNALNDITQRLGALERSVADLKQATPGNLQEMAGELVLKGFWEGFMRLHRNMERGIEDPKSGWGMIRSLLVQELAGYVRSFGGTLVLAEEAREGSAVSFDPRGHVWQHPSNPPAEGALVTVLLPGWTLGNQKAGPVVGPDKWWGN
ncbi:MAG TPA: hypothetical protein VLH79_10365, partial [Chthonomonadales bacterium]|nr:hypothetical protein [Chthonomonadales bacterium]